MDLKKLKTYFYSYGFDENEPICMSIVDCNIEHNNQIYCLCLIESMDAKYSRIEEFIPVALYNSLESIYKDDAYDSYAQAISPELLRNSEFKTFLLDFEIRLDFDSVFLIYDNSNEKIFVGKLRSGAFFSLALLYPVF